MCGAGLACTLMVREALAGPTHGQLLLPEMIGLLQQVLQLVGLPSQAGKALPTAGIQALSTQIQLSQGSVCQDAVVHRALDAA